MLNIVVPMAGLGSRFSRAGYALPKPLIPIHEVPMIRLVIENIRPQRSHRFVFICQLSHVQEFSLRELLGRWAPGSKIIELDSVTQGAACTVLTAATDIDNDDSLMIANSDQYVDVGIDDYLAAFDRSRLDGFIMTMKANDPKWSFVGFGTDGNVARVVEKEVISDQATVGVYNFRRGSDFVRAARAMIAKELRVNNEFYVAPVYNELIAGNAAIGTYEIGSAGHGMYGLGVPDDLNDFLALPLSAKATSGLTP